MTARKLILAPAAALATLFAATTVVADEGVPSASDFNTLQRYAIGFDEPREAAELYIKDFGLKPRDAKYDIIDGANRRSDKILIATIEGIEDPTVQGVQWRLLIRFSEGNWEAVEAGMRRKCHNGANAGQWTKDVCP